MDPPAQPPGESGEFRARPEQPRVDEIEDGPQIGEPVLDRGPGQDDPRPGVKCLDGAGLPGRGILDRLRLVEDRQPPLHAGEPGDSQQRSIARDHQVPVLKFHCRDLSEFRSGHGRRVSHQGAQTRRESLDLGHPVREQRCRGNQEARTGLRVASGLEGE